MNRRTTEGFLRGTATREGLESDRGHGFSLAFQNEFAVGWLDGLPRVMTPDLICLMDTVSGDAIGTETLKFSAPPPGPPVPPRHATHRYAHAAS